MTPLQGVAPVFRREFKSYFSSPLGYVFIIIFLVASGYLTVSRDFGRFLEIRQSNLDAFFASVPWIFVVLVPAVAMRLWAEERKSGTIELLLTLPISMELPRLLAAADLAGHLSGRAPRRSRLGRDPHRVYRMRSRGRCVPVGRHAVLGRE